MNSRARVEAALAGDAPDRPPATSWGHTYKEEWSPEALARVTVERQRRFGWDFVKFQPRASCFAEAFGSEYRPSNHALRAPKLVRHAVTSVDDWRQIGQKAEEKATGKATGKRGGEAGSRLGHNRALADQVEAIRLVCAELGPGVPVVQTVFSPITIAGYLVGKDKRRAVRHLRENPEVVGAALKRVAGVLAEFSRQSVAAGAAGIFYAISGYASRDVMKQDEYERLVLPYDLAVLEKLPSEAWLNILHMCGSHLNFELARQLPVSVVSWSVQNQGNPSLTEGRERGGKPVMGGMAQAATLHHGSVEEVTREAREALRETDGRGFILAPGCSVRPGARNENLVAMMKAVAA